MKNRINNNNEGRKNGHSQNISQEKQVWRELYDRQMEKLPGLACREFLEGLAKAGFTRENVPDFGQLNRILRGLTDWELVPVEGIVEDRKFFKLLSERKFPATTWLRSPEQIDYLEEPDMFHDVFAHVPLLTNYSFASFLEHISRTGLQYAGNQDAVALLARIYWFTVEFGLIRENGSLRIYGAGILSSSGESDYAVGRAPMHFEYNVEQILNTSFHKDNFQDRYFIIDSFEQLFKSSMEISGRIEEIISKRLIFEQREGRQTKKNAQDLVTSW